MQPPSMSTSIWLKAAGLVGASGVCLAAYGAHGLKNLDPHFDEVYRRANQQHMYHAALLAVVPMSRRPHLTGGLTLAGIMMFSGSEGKYQAYQFNLYDIILLTCRTLTGADSSCYMAALKQDRSFGKLAPYGGFSLILAWLSLLL